MVPAIRSRAGFSPSDATVLFSATAATPQASLHRPNHVRMTIDFGTFGAFQNRRDFSGHTGWFSQGFLHGLFSIERKGARID
jgi:hypothetical protein